MGGGESVPERRMILLGKTGAGKSSAGNTILRKNVFTTEASSNSVTGVSVRGDGKVDGRKVTVIDPPGIFDTVLHDEVIKSRIIRSVIECAPGIDAFVIVLNVIRYTTQETEIVDNIFKYFGEETFNHSVVLFTHGEQLEGQNIREFVSMSPKLQELVDKCGGRCHVIDNKYWTKCFCCPCIWGYNNRVQVKKLLDTIDEMVQMYGRYSNELLQRLEVQIQEQINNINEHDLSAGERRESAIGTLLCKLAGVTTGLLTGALMSTVVAVAAVLTVLEEAESSQGVTAARAALAVGTTAGVAGTIATGATVSVIALGGIGGAVAGWEAANEADSVFDAMNRAATANYENGTIALERTREFISSVFNRRVQSRS